MKRTLSYNQLNKDISVTLLKREERAKDNNGL